MKILTDNELNTYSKLDIMTEIKNVEKYISEIKQKISNIEKVYDININANIIQHFNNLGYEIEKIYTGKYKICKNDSVFYFLIYFNPPVEYNIEFDRENYFESIILASNIVKDIRCGLFDPLSCELNTLSNTKNDDIHNLNLDAYKIYLNKLNHIHLILNKKDFIKSGNVFIVKKLLRIKLENGTRNRNAKYCLLSEIHIIKATGKYCEFKIKDKNSDDFIIYNKKITEKGEKIEIKTDILRRTIDEVYSWIDNGTIELNIVQNRISKLKTLLGNSTD